MILQLFENGTTKPKSQNLKIILALRQRSQKFCLTNQNTKKEIWENLLISLPPSPISKKVYTLSQFQGGGDHFYCIWPTQLCKKKEAFVAELEQAKDIIDKWMIHCQWCETNAWWIRTMLGEGNAKVFRWRVGPRSWLKPQKFWGQGYWNYCSENDLIIA